MIGEMPTWATMYIGLVEVIYIQPSHAQSAYTLYIHGTCIYGCLKQGANKCLDWPQKCPMSYQLPYNPLFPDFKAFGRAKIKVRTKTNSQTHRSPYVQLFVSSYTEHFPKHLFSF